VLNDQLYQRIPGDLPEVFFGATVALTYLTLVWELTFPLLVCFRATRPVCAGDWLLLHLGMWVTLEVGAFMPTVLIAYVAFLDPCQTERAGATLATLGSSGRPLREPRLMRNHVTVLGLVAACAASWLPSQPSATPRHPRSASSTCRTSGASYAIWGVDGRRFAGPHLPRHHEQRPGQRVAHLFRYDPQSDAITDCGNVVEELTRLGLRAAGDKQMKIHSRIVQMPDGYVYFASMDETGEQDDGSKLPTWGGHLWRMGSTGRWQHLGHTGRH
jgi:hypothetical protein